MNTSTPSPTGLSLVEETDSDLLASFAAERNEAAFAELVRRHYGLVMGVCRRVLRNSHDIEDVFQATFLVLVRKAGSLRDRELLGNWLYGVAYRVALRARADRARRHARETSDVEDPAGVGPHDVVDHGPPPAAVLAE